MAAYSRNTILDTKALSLDETAWDRVAL